MNISIESQEKKISEQDVRNIMENVFENISITSRRVLVIIPDSTRTAPMPLFIRMFIEVLESRVKKLGFLIALGTHPLMSKEKIKNHYGITNEAYFDFKNKVSIFNHQWDLSDSLTKIGKINKEVIDEITGGLLRFEMPITINKNIFDYDLIVICGTVFPHEIVGFSGGDKYFFPGISGPEVIDFSHWLGALLTSKEVIGISNTPVRTLIEKAASMITIPRIYFNMVVSEEGLAGLFVGDNKESWFSAVELSSKLHITYKNHSYDRVLSVMPSIYDDLWTAAKGMYKVEPVISDGGEVIIYAPEINEISYTHGKLIDQIGYHVRDYYVKQWDVFKHHPWSILGHSTHLRGSGEFDLVNKIEKPRIQVTLATGIQRSRCEKVNLGYMDPASISLDEWINKEEKGILFVPRAGEKLYRIKKLNMTE